MKIFLVAWFGALLSLAGVSLASAADAPKGPYDVMIFVDVAPSATAEAVAAFRQYRDAERKEPGVMLAEVYQELNTPSRFITHDIWKDYDSYLAHSKAASTADLFAKLKPIQFGPPDVHPHVAVSVAPDGKGPANILIVSHLDVTPNALPTLLAMLKPVTDGTAKDPGMIKFEILRQAPDHTNHFRLWEIWASEKDWQAHNLAKHTQDFRNGLAPLLGTPYDQRKYTVMN